jgi:hypothetical protein
MLVVNQTSDFRREIFMHDFHIERFSHAILCDKLKNMHTEHNLTSIKQAKQFSFSRGGATVICIETYSPMRIDIDKDGKYFDPHGELAKPEYQDMVVDTSGGTQN